MTLAFEERYKAAEVFYGAADSEIRYYDSGIGIEGLFKLIGGKQNYIISDKKLMSFKKYTEKREVSILWNRFFRR